MKVTTLVPWFGSNRTLAHTVGESLAGCRWVGVPFAGGMSELVHIKAPTIVVNDLHRHVINLATCISDRKIGPELYRSLRRVPFHPNALEFSQAWCKMHKGTCPGAIPDIDAGYHYFVSQWMGRSAKSGLPGEFDGGLPVRWNANGGDSNTRYRSAVSSLGEWRRIMLRCNFTCVDCFDFFTRVVDAKGTGIYCDPPFPDVGNCYLHSFTEEQHRRLADILGAFTATRVVCRFYDHPLIRELYPESHWKWKALEGRKQSNARADELLIVAN